MKSAEEAFSPITAEFYLSAILSSYPNPAGVFLGNSGFDAEDAKRKLDAFCEARSLNLPEREAHQMKLFVLLDYLHEINGRGISSMDILYAISALDLGIAGVLLKNGGITASMVKASVDNAVPDGDIEALRNGAVHNHVGYLFLDLPDGSIFMRKARALHRAKTIKCHSDALLMDGMLTDFNALAESGSLERAIGREKEVIALIEVLCRRNKRNPVLLGEAGVGKTAIVEELAIRLVSGKVPRKLMGKRILSLNYTSLLSNTKYRGELEGKLNRLVEEVSSRKDAVLFIDEMHMIVGSLDDGKSANIANMLKPALARGSLSCIGATTEDEYSRFIEPDNALARRFSPIKVLAPDKKSTENILNRLKAGYSSFHGCVYKDNIISYIVNCADEFMPTMHNPDKSIDILDASGALAAIKNTDVDRKIVAEIISKRTGIPVFSMLGNGCRDFGKLEQKLEERVVGQKDAIRRLLGLIRHSEYGVWACHPRCCIRLCGPKGCGKRLVSGIIASELYNDSENVLKLNMEEYGDSASLARLVGDSYGFSKGGILSAHLAKHPYCLIILENMPEADHGVREFFQNIAKTGKFSDGAGKTVNCAYASFFSIEDRKALRSSSMGFVPGASRSDSKQEIWQDVEFSKLNREELEQVARLEIKRINGDFAWRKLAVEFSDFEISAFSDSARSAGHLVDILKDAARKKLEGGLAVSANKEEEYG